MTGAWKRGLFVTAASFALACPTQDQASEQGSETDPAVDEAAVREAIEANDEAYEQAFTAGDAATVATFYTTDGVVLIPNGPRVDGAAAIEQAIAGLLEQGPGAALDLTTRDVHVAAAGDYAYATGSYSLSVPVPDGPEWTDAGKFVAVWKNQDGAWKMAADIWNSDTPLAAPDGAAADGITEAGEPSE